MIRLLMILAIILTILLMQRILNVSIISVIKDIKFLAQGIIDDRSTSMNLSNRRKMDIQSRKEKEESFKFKMYNLLSNMIIDLGWDKYSKMNVEYLVIIVFIVGALVQFLISNIITNNIVRFLMYFVVVYWIFTLLYIKSRDNAKRRIIAVREAVNLISQNIKPSFQQTLEIIVDMVDPSIRNIFEMSLDKIQNQNMSIGQVVDELELKLGSQSHSVLHKVRVFTRSGKPGMIDTFKDDIDINALAREMEIESSISIQEGQKEFYLLLSLVAISIMIGFAFIPGCRELYKSPIGQVVILFELIFIAVLITKLERIDSKPFI